jgi:DNA modification methylase
MSEATVEVTEEELLYGGGATSIFDPVLCEIAYRWFCPPKGVVLDPFAGGSVRGIVAAKLGRRYIGIDVRGVQIEANYQQAKELLIDGLAIVPDTPDDNMPDVTDVEFMQSRNIWLKREDLYSFASVRGAKVRTCMHFIRQAKEMGVGVVTAGSRMSPQVNFVAQIAYTMGVKCSVHVPSGPLTPELIAARSAGAKITQHDYGYNSVIIARAREDAAQRGWVEIPYGMESQEAVDYTKPQVVNIPDDAKRLVNACGSGMTLAGILWGLKETGRNIPVIAICVGNVPAERLDRWAPPDWRDMVELIDEESDYHVPAVRTDLDGVLLDAYYEAKCIPYLREGDLLWVSAIRPSAVPASAPDPIWIEGDGLDVNSLYPEGTEDADFIFTCPPYGDLEVYSDDPRDLSTMEYPKFLATFAEIMAESAKRLKDDRFACVVVGDFRDPAGYFRGFPADTVKIMEAAGLHLYNEAILVTHAASLPLRAGRQFDATRKMGKTHQNVYVFVKGDPRKATRACGPVVAMDASEGASE